VHVFFYVPVRPAFHAYALFDYKKLSVSYHSMQIITNEILMVMSSKLFDVPQRRVSPLCLDSI